MAVVPIFGGHMTISTGGRLGGQRLGELSLNVAPSPAVQVNLLAEPELEAAHAVAGLMAGADVIDLDVSPVEVSVIVPTRNESANVAELVRRLDDAFDTRSMEVVFVDDSTDETPAVIREVAEGSRRRVRLLHRSEEKRVDGLGGAVVAGLTAARGAWVVVMDGDLQHPPQLAPVLVATGEREGADVVVGSRYTGGGDNAGLDGVSRRVVSSSATWCARALFPSRLRRVTDPMSGFFAVRRDRLRPSDLRPHGFKILLEVLVRHPGLRMTEVGFVFGERFAGESKASLREGVRYVRHLSRLRMTGYVASLRRRRATLTRALLFGGAGVTGIGVNALALWAFVAGVHAPYLVGAALATQVSTTWNWALTETLVFPGPKPRTTARRYLSFSAVNNAALLLRLPVLALLVSALGMHYLLANLLTLAAAFLVRFAASDRLIYRLDGGVA